MVRGGDGYADNTEYKIYFTNLFSFLEMKRTVYQS